MLLIGGAALRLRLALLHFAAVLALVHPKPRLNEWKHLAQPLTINR